MVGGDWHQAVPLDVVERALRERRFSAITVVHSETSTGTLTALPELAALAHQYGAAVLVDSVTGIGGVPVETDAWDLDFVLTGSQKALALPPGLAFGVASARYIEQARQATARGLYFDMVEFEEFVHKNQTPSTPALSLLYATAVQGEHIARETIEARWARHAEMAAMTHDWVRRLREATGESFCVYAPEHARSSTVTAIALPPTLKGDDIVKGVAKRGFVIGGGYGKLKSSTFRIGHMGDHTPDRLALCLEATADTIRELLK